MLKRNEFDFYFVTNICSLVIIVVSLTCTAYQYLAAPPNLPRREEQGKISKLRSDC